MPTLTSTPARMALMGVGDIECAEGSQRCMGKMAALTLNTNTKTRAVTTIKGVGPRSFIFSARSAMFTVPTWA